MATTRDWQSQSIVGLRRLKVDRMPGMEILFLDALAVHLLGPEAPRSPYTIEHGTTVVQHLLWSVTASFGTPEGLDDDLAASESATIEVGRQAVVAGAHRFADRGRPGVQQLASRYLGAAVGELAIHVDSAEKQVRSLFHYGLLAIASGPENRLSEQAADGCLEIFRWWDDRIGEGYAPRWRVPAK